MRKQKANNAPSSSLVHRARPPWRGTTMRDDGRESTAHNMQQAARHAVAKNPLSIQKLHPKQWVNDTIDDWEELTDNSRSWAPCGAIERHGHPAHSMAAFKAVYELKGKIAAGGCAKVHVAVRRRSGRTVAVKMVRPSGNMTARDIRAEADVMRHLDHPHVIRTLDAFWTATAGAWEEVWLVQEYAGGGELFEWCRRRGRPLRESDHRRLATELLSGLAYLHGHGVIHRDIKPKNLLMADASESAPLRIADFGLCRRLRKGEGSTSQVTAPEWRRKQRSVTKSFLGTADWMAPEVTAGSFGGACGAVARKQRAPLCCVCSSVHAPYLHSFPRTPKAMLNPIAPPPICLIYRQVLVCACEGAGGYSFPADIWASGCVIYSLMSGRLDDSSPFTPEIGNQNSESRSSLEGLFGAVLSQQLLKFEQAPSVAAKNFLAHLLAPVPQDRPTAAQALKHKWLHLARNQGTWLPPASRHATRKVVFERGSAYSPTTDAPAGATGLVRRGEVERVVAVGCTPGPPPRTAAAPGPNSGEGRYFHRPDVSRVDDMAVPLPRKLLARGVNPELLPRLDLSTLPTLMKPALHTRRPLFDIRPPLSEPWVSLEGTKTILRPPLPTTSRAAFGTTIPRLLQDPVARGAWTAR